MSRLVLLKLQACCWFTHSFPRLPQVDLFFLEVLSGCGKGMILRLFLFLYQDRLLSPRSRSSGREGKHQQSKILTWLGALCSLGPGGSWSWNLCVGLADVFCWFMSLLRGLYKGGLVRYLSPLVLFTQEEASFFRLISSDFFHWF